MTVGDFVAKWLMRFEQSSRILRLPLLGMTAVSTFVTALKGTWLQDYTVTLLGIGLLGVIVFTLIYDESGVLNQQNRSQMDRSDNFAGPGMAMGNLLKARQLAVAVEALQEDKPPEAVHEELEMETKKLLKEFRDGIDLGDVYGEEKPTRAVADGGEEE